MTDMFGNEEVRALSWKEPFASLMLLGKIETRTWATKYRGKVLICASAKEYNLEQIRGIAGHIQANRIKAANIDYSSLGRAIAVGTLVDCRKMQITDEDKCFVKYFPDLWCHVYANVVPIQSFVWKGSQGWKRLNQEEKSKIILL